MHLFNPAVLIRRLWQYRELTWQLTLREILTRYRGSYLGVLWALLTPLAMLMVYTFIFSVLFKAKWGAEAGQSTVDFALTAFTGMTAYGLFGETLNRAPGLVLGNPSYVKRVVFPLEVLPISVLGSNFVHSCVGLAIVLIGMLLTVGHLYWTLLLLPLVYVPLAALTLGIAWVLSSLGVYIRDMGNLVLIATQILFFMTPILYPMSIVPEAIQPVYRYNPLTVIVDSFRRVILWGQMPEWFSFGLVTLLSLLVLLVGYAWFMKTKQGFADVL